jgi:hypothetical protein
MTNTITNLPQTASNDSASKTKKFFNNYYSKSIAIPADVLAGTTAFFEARGFDPSASQSVASAMISQAKAEGVDVFKLLDTLKGLNQLQLSRIVTEILNYNRLNTSVLGTRFNDTDQNNYDIRNIMV